MYFKLNRMELGEMASELRAVRCLFCSVSVLVLVCRGSCVLELSASSGR